jgi:REP element-mobilizing transposase RayT
MDVNRAAQHLTRLLLETAAQAALIVRGAQLWAYAGHLPQPAAHELAEQLVKYHSSREGDLARSIRLKTNELEYMLYATSLGGDDMTLALAFESSTPFTKMRAQAANLAKALANPVVETPFVDDVGAESAWREPEPRLAEPMLPALPDLPPLHPGDEELPMLDLGDVPPPNPGRSRRPKTSPLRFIESEPIAAEPARPEEGAPPEGRSIPMEMPLSMVWDALPEALPADGVAAPPRDEIPPQIAEIPLGEPVSEWIPESQMATTPIRVAESLAETTPITLPEPAPKTQPRFEPPTPALISIQYACALAPRLPQHHLVGELAAWLPGQLHQICLAFGWRLEHIAVRPDYLQWNVSAPPSDSPSVLMYEIRTRTSRALFEQFPAYARENPSGDFWAPGYFMLSSHQPPPAEFVKDYIAGTRRSQGINP